MPGDLRADSEGHKFLRRVLCDLYTHSIFRHPTVISDKVTDLVIVEYSIINQELSFLSRDSNGLLVLSLGSFIEDILAIRLVNGRVSLSFQNHGGDQSALTSGSYDDGKIHTLQFSHLNTNISLIVDGREQPSIMGNPAGEGILSHISLPPCNHHTHTHLTSVGVREFSPQLLYIGGAPPTLPITGDVEAVQGCLFDFSFSVNTSATHNLIDPAISTLSTR